MPEDPLPDPVPPLTEDETKQVDDLYTKLKLEGIAAGREYVLCHTPARLQKAMHAKADADFPPPPEPAAPAA